MVFFLLLNVVSNGPCVASCSIHVYCMSLRVHCTGLLLAKNMFYFAVSFGWSHTPGICFFFNFRSYYHTPTHHSNKSMIQLRAHLRFVLAGLRRPRLQRECNGQWQNGWEGTQKEYMHGLVPFALHKQSQCLLGLLSCPLSFHQSSTKFSRLYYYFYIKEDLQNSRAPYLSFLNYTVQLRHS